MRASTLPLPTRALTPINCCVRGENDATKMAEKSVPAAKIPAGRALTGRHVAGSKVWCAGAWLCGLRSRRLLCGGLAACMAGLGFRLSVPDARESCMWPVHPARTLSRQNWAPAAAKIALRGKTRARLSTALLLPTLSQPEHHPARHYWSGISDLNLPEFNFVVIDFTPC